MPIKRKRDIRDDFDPNQSDPDDENFDPSEDRPVSRAKRPARGSSQRDKPARRKRGTYRGSDIDDDDDELLEDSQEESFGEASDIESEDAGLTATGRHSRRAARSRKQYVEVDTDEELEEVNIEDEDDEEIVAEPPRKKPRSKIVVLKTRSAASKRAARAAAQAPLKRSTRANTEDAELVELSNSGRHAQRASRSPEAAAADRPTRGGKGLKRPPSMIIEEPTQENIEPVPESEAEAEAEAEAQPEAAAPREEDEEDELAGDAHSIVVGSKVASQQASPEADDDDDVLLAPRRTRAARKSNSPANDSDAPAAAPTRRLSQRKGKKATDQSSDFEPGNESEDIELGSDQEEEAEAGGDEDDWSGSGPRRGRTRTKKEKTSRRKRSREDSADADEELDRAELNEELRELGRTRSRTAARRRSDDEITYEVPNKRRRTAAVNYAIQPLGRLIADEEEDDANNSSTRTPSRGKRRNGASSIWKRTLVSTYGPFGGGGAGSVLEGPWGTGAVAGVDSDSSDDEGMRRPSAVKGGMVGMTPTAATAPVFGGVNQAAGLEALGVGAAPNVGQLKDRKALADADPLGVDLNVSFNQVGGLQGHIEQLKEMVQLPLLYPEVFQRFHVTPPRGVLFHGPPGTGKTLLARALANSMGVGGKKVTFYMRKGADALSKWVGEAEKQLRLLFEEARRTQPSIIFFDEIDGLAPVRSSKQEQIHASIVSTLLALMDGMDGRGQVIVIGATNRPDNIDPALRRPGRFDREFYFPLPDVEGRKAILDIHTKDWGLPDAFKQDLAENTKGYGGADLRALTTEAALNSIQRTFPQIYSSTDKLAIDPAKINVHATDFLISIKKMVPSSERSAATGAAPIPKSLEPLLREQFATVERVLADILPRKKQLTALGEAMYEPYEDADGGFQRENMQRDFERSRIFRPRLLLTGEAGMGQGYLSSAILHHFEGVHIENFDLGTLLGDGRPISEVIVAKFVEVKRHKPAVILIPDIETWYETIGEGSMNTFKVMLRSIPPTDPVLVLGTAECEAEHISSVIMRDVFGFSRKNRVVIERPDRLNRAKYFSNIIDNLSKTPNDFPDPTSRKKRVLEMLPIVPAPPPKPRSKEEIRAEEKRDKTMLNYLKVRLQPIMDQIKQKYRAYRFPPIDEKEVAYLFEESDPNFVRADVDAPRPFEIAKDKDGTPGLRETATGKFWYNLSTTLIEERLSNGFYAKPSAFTKDIRALAKDAKNAGDREKVIKANELLANVEIDMAGIEPEAGGPAVWDALYERQKERYKKQAEATEKRKALQPFVDQIQADVSKSTSSGLGPIQLGEPVPRGHAATTTSHFQLIGSDTSHSLTNGTSDASKPSSQMGPPPPVQWPRMSAAAVGDSTRVTVGDNTPMSQMSAFTGLPQGVSPSAVPNEASPTKTSDPSTKHSSGSHSTQLTNGNHSNVPEPAFSQQLPATQEMDVSGHSQTSSDSPWMHSQAQALATGRMASAHTPLGFPAAAPQQPQAATPTSTQAGPGERAASRPSVGQPATTVPNESNNTSPSVRGSDPSSNSSQPHQQAVSVNDGTARKFLDELTLRTSGCTIEQLEQINRELMNGLWQTRSEWNRMKVFNHLKSVFNDTIEDIQSMQRLAKSSQEEDADTSGEQRGDEVEGGGTPAGGGDVSMRYSGYQHSSTSRQR